MNKTRELGGVAIALISGAVLGGSIDHTVLRSRWRADAEATQGSLSRLCEVARQADQSAARSRQMAAKMATVDYEAAASAVELPRLFGSPQSLEWVIERTRDAAAFIRTFRADAERSEDLAQAVELETREMLRLCQSPRSPMA